MASRTARKNSGALETTARRLAADGIDLVAAGGDRPQFRDEPGTSAVRALGHVPDAHLPGLYAGARAFVLPSWHEGFGLTCIEAMACGVPVVAARAGALPETCADAARYADPFDQDESPTRCSRPRRRRAARRRPAPRGAVHVGAHGRRARRAPERRLTRRILEAEMEQQSAALRAMNDAVLAIAAEATIEPMLQRLAHSARELVDAALCRASACPTARGPSPSSSPRA